MYTQIFPYLYTDETQTETLTYLCFEVDVPRLSSGTVKDMNIIVLAYCHKDIMKYSKKGYYGIKSTIRIVEIENDDDSFTGGYNCGMYIAMNAKKITYFL